MPSSCRGICCHSRSATTRLWRSRSSTRSRPIGPNSSNRLSLYKKSFQIGASKQRTLAVVYFWIAVGSALGGMARFWCSGVIARMWGETFPWGTLFVNVTGSFVIGLIAALSAPDGRIFISSTARLALMAGICGGYTTFSSFSLQTMSLMNDGEWLYGGANIVGSVTLGLLAVWAGMMLGALFNAR